MTDDSTARVFQPPDVSTSSLAHNTLLNYLGSTLNLLNGVAGSILMARRLGPEQLGIYSGASFVVGLSLSIFGFGIAATAVKILSEYGARFDPGMIARVVRLFAFGVIAPASLAAVAVAIALPLSSNDNRYTPLVVALAASSAIPAHLAQSYRGIVSGFQEFGYLLRINLVAALLLLVGNVVCALFFTNVGAFIVAGMVPNTFIAFAVLSHYRAYLFRHAPAAALPRERLAEIYSYLWPVALTIVLDAIVWQYSEVLFLGRFRSAQEVAFYSVSFWLATLLLRTVASSVTAGFVPALSQLYGSGDESRIRTAFYTGVRMSVLFVAPLATMIAVVARPVVLLLYGEDYAVAAAYVPALVAAAAFASISSIASDVMYSTRQQRVLLLIAIITAIINIGLDLWLIPSLGILGAVVANCAAQTASAMTAMVICFARYGQAPNGRAYFGPVTASLIVAAGTWPIVHYVHSPLSIVAVGLLGSFEYLVVVRALRLLSSSDADLLTSIASHVPHLGTRKLLLSVLRVCARSAA